MFCVLANPFFIRWPSQLELKNTPTASLQSGKTPNVYPGYDTKLSDGEPPVMLEHWKS